MQIPRQAIGRIVGKQGRNIQALQQIPGIRFAEMNASKTALSFGGTADAVARVASDVEKLINLAQAPNLTELALTVAEFGVTTVGDVMLSFLPTERLQLPVTLGESPPGREHFVLQVEKNAGIEDRLAAVSLSQGVGGPGASRRPGPKGRFVLGLESCDYVPDLEALIGKLRAMAPGPRIRLDARYGMLLFAFPPTGLARGRLLPMGRLPQLDLRSDLEARFFGSMQPEPLERIWRFLEAYGFVAVPPDHRKLVKLIDTATSDHLSITVAELEDGGDARLGTSLADAGKEELERLRRCRTCYEVLGLEAGCSDRDVSRAYRRLALLVHPDKNGHDGAESAMKAVTYSKSMLEDSAKRESYRLRPMSPPPIDTAPAADTRRRLRVVKCHGSYGKHLLLDVLKDGEELGSRVVVRSYADHSQDAALMQFLDEAWARREEGMLSTANGSRYRVETVRHKTSYRFVDGDLKVVVDKVRQQNVGSGRADERWEVEVRSRELKLALRAAAGGTGDVGDAELVRRFRDFVRKVDALGAAMTSQAIRRLEAGADSEAGARPGSVPSHGQALRVH